MIRTIAIAAALSAAAIAVPAAAQSVEYKALESKSLGTKTSIEATKGYILVSAPNRVFGTFIKTPDQDELAEHRAEWEKRFEKAKKRYASDLKNWTLLSKQGRVPGAKPVEPTEATFSIGDIERLMTVSFGPMFAFEKGEDDSVSYLIQVEPGTYTYYGPVMVMPNGAAAGSCFCMGTVQFEAKPGVITNLGDFITLGWVDDAGARQMAAVTVGEGRMPKPASYPIPAALAKYTVEQADWRAAGKRNNFLGINVMRMPPVPGVMAYDRDRIVDLRAQAATTVAAPAPAAAATEAAAQPGT